MIMLNYSVKLLRQHVVDHILMTLVVSRLHKLISIKMSHYKCMPLW